MSFSKIIPNSSNSSPSHLLDNHPWQGLDPHGPVHRGLQGLVTGGELEQHLPCVHVGGGGVQQGSEPDGPWIVVDKF